MGSRKRQEAIANGKIVESAEAVRRRRRAEASAMREELAIEMWAQGATSTQISEALFERYGVRLVKNIPDLVRRGLYRRVQANKENVEVAQELLLTHYRALIEVWMPRAIGAGISPDTELPNTPDLRAAEYVLRLLDKWGVAAGAVAPPKAGNINIGIVLPPDADSQRGRVMEALRREHEKQMEIEGALAGTPATGADVDYDVLDGMVLPPVPTAPTQER